MTTPTSWLEWSQNQLVMRLVPAQAPDTRLGLLHARGDEARGTAYAG
ncbi:hypothetical protein SGL43_06604 [Streptomyces globisporus]|uniref:Uncharacterized protein n=1 Tax=Streptomyces globisporus TaxID=1908 RepID=A0ABN8VD46_STRGL|nr:hypothetical protein SGL43_06604 [Streptomyces globisporus]